MLIPEELVVVELDFPLLEFEFWMFGVEVRAFMSTARSVLLLASLIDIDETSLKSGSPAMLLSMLCFLPGDFVLLAVFMGVTSEFDDELRALASLVFFRVTIAQPSPIFFSAVSISSDDEAHFTMSDVGVLIISEIPDKPEKLFELVDVIFSALLSLPRPSGFSVLDGSATCWASSRGSYLFPSLESRSSSGPASRSALQLNSRSLDFASSPLRDAPHSNDVFGPCDNRDFVVPLSENARGL